MTKRVGTIRANDGPGAEAKADRGVRKRWGIGLRGKLFVLLFAVNLGISASFALILYHSLRKGILDETDGQLLAVAHGVRQMIPPDYFDRVARGDVISEADYVTLVLRLNDYVSAADLAYIYALIEDDNHNILQAVTSSNLNELEWTYERARSPYPSAPAAVRETFASRQVRTETYRDAYGEFRSVFLPARAPSGRTYVIGVDKHLSTLSARLTRALELTATVGIVAFGLSCAVGSLAISRLVRPLRDLTLFARQTQASHFALPAEGLPGVVQLRRSDEIGDLFLAMREMLSSLNRHIVDLQVANTARAWLEAEFAAAHDIQQGMVPQGPPALPDWSRMSLAAVIEPAKSVGGDLYDYFSIGEDRLFFIIGDVSGKGLPAALFMAITCTLFRILAMKGEIRLDEVMTHANRYLVDNNPSTMFVTVFAGILDLRNGHVVYADGGHEPPILLRADGRAEDLAKIGRMALGVMDCPYATGSFDLAPGEGFVLFTDGVTEATSPDRMLFTRERALRSVSGQQGAAASVVLRRMLDDVHSFTANAPQHDDITVLAVRYDSDPYGLQRYDSLSADGNDGSRFR